MSSWSCCSLARTWAGRSWRGRGRGRGRVRDGARGARGLWALSLELEGGWGTRCAIVCSPLLRTRRREGRGSARARLTGHTSFASWFSFSFNIKRRGQDDIDVALCGGSGRLGERWSTTVSNPERRQGRPTLFRFASSPEPVGRRRGREAIAGSGFPLSYIEPSQSVEDHLGPLLLLEPASESGGEGASRRPIAGASAPRFGELGYAIYLVVGAPSRTPLRLEGSRAARRKRRSRLVCSLNIERPARAIQLLFGLQRSASRRIIAHSSQLEAAGTSAKTPNLTL